MASPGSRRKVTPSTALTYPACPNPNFLSSNQTCRSSMSSSALRALGVLLEGVVAVSMGWLRLGRIQGQRVSAAPDSRVQPALDFDAILVEGWRLLAAALETRRAAV